ncbi:hypothetical protein HG536_0H00740 [Torulaspora globosa]|uniref:Rrn9 domain-containing protein n=1 Tax=Torulaspora globosa TaxID=48254 RepID=A0A7G3ZMG3_9SACH|nr:uncharacterized protein HG536_0H00740 [Torulaspora globosa]QLL34699.1 hypothetical protein HG536_0H00740 [Torulaspora globosa]
MSDSEDDGAGSEGRPIDQEVVKTANELLDSLEQSHRSDLALHLYSSYLLKNLLYRANERKHGLEIDRFVRTHIRDNWTRWPDPRTVVDPQVNRLYEDDNYGERQDSELEPGEISAKALVHASNMLRMELDSFWQHSLAQSAAKAEVALDVDKMAMPKELSDHVMWKLDHFFNGIHNKIAARNKIEIQQAQSSQQLTVSQASNDKVKASNRTELTYHDIIARGCEMGEDMEEIYVKSLELFNDIPSSFDKSRYKLPKSVIRSFKSTAPSKSCLSAMKGSRDDYVALEKLLKDKRLLASDKIHLRKISKRSIDQNLSKKSFFSVQAAKSYEQEIHARDDPDIDSYTQEDCLVKIPRLNR